MTRKTTSVVAVIVTYGERAELCLRVVAAAFENGVSQVVVVDNGSQEANATKLQQAAAQDPCLHLLRISENLGSAGGVARGLTHAISLKPDDIWILDDDNLPRGDCLKTLLSVRSAINTDFQDAVLYCYRGSTRINDLKSAERGTIKRYGQNTFLAFSAGSLLIGKFCDRKSALPISYPVIRTYIGPYGGMFAPRTIFESLGLPREDYFLYADDHEYCSRMVRMGVDQFLVYSAQVEDLDVSFANGNGLLDLHVSEFKVYFQVRNHTHLGMQNIDCRLCYEVNKAVFLLVQLFRVRHSIMCAPRQVFKRLRLILAAISDGENGRLGRRNRVTDVER